MAMEIFGQLDWLTTRVKRLCCAVEQIQQSGAGSYKVYTALLTQSGGDNQAGINWDDPSPSLTIGVTYTIQDNGSGLDMTNVGAPNNDINTSFVATGTTPNSWGAGVVIYNTGAPVVTVLENTIGNVWFTYSNVGVYKLNNETLTELSNLYFAITPLEGRSIGFTWNDEDGSGAFILSSQLSAGSWVRYNDSLSNTPIEIRVYN